VVVYTSFSQVYKDSWGIGFGITSPRIMGDISTEEINFGGHLNLIAEVTESDAFRFRFNYLMLTGTTLPKKFENTAIIPGFDYLKKFSYCTDFDLYLGAGFSFPYYTIKNSTNVRNDTYFGELAASIWLGGYYDLGDDWSLNAELGNSTVSSDKFDGKTDIQGGLFGGTLDSYIQVNFGVTYFFSRGEESSDCEMYGGIKTIKEEPKEKFDSNEMEKLFQKYSYKPADLDYDKIEEIVRKVIKEESKANIERQTSNWVLVGVNFGFNSVKLEPESFPILLNAIQVLTNNPNLKVEIQGYTDNIGSKDFNKKLSLHRAEVVKRFLVSKGINQTRLTTVGFGSDNPVSDNLTQDGRSLNRRIEFKILSK
jgi:OOP family OmpA-OmpF porin